MIPFCRIVLTLVSCTFDPATPRTTHAAAAAILQESPGLSNRTHVPPPPADADSPHVVISYSSPTAGPFGEFPAFTPARRLDETWLWDPPTVYGRLPWDVWPASGVAVGAHHRTPSPAAAFGPRDRAAYRPRDLREAPIVRERSRAPAPVAIVGAAPMAGGSMSRGVGPLRAMSRQSVDRPARTVTRLRSRAV